MFKVYVLKSEKDGNFYIGCTSDLKTRLEFHNDGKVRSTKSRRPLELVYSEIFENKHEAFNAEKLYKTAKWKKWLLKKSCV